MLSAIRKLFRTRSTEHRKLQPDYEAPVEVEQNEKNSKIKQKKQKPPKKQRRQLITRIDESGGTRQSATNSSASTDEHCNNKDGTGIKCGGGGVSFGDCNKTGSNNTSSSSSSTTTNCNSSSSTGSNNSSSNDSGTSSSNSTGPIKAVHNVKQEVTEAGDKQQQQQQQEQLKQLESQTQIAEDYEEEEEDDYDDNFEEDFNEEMEDGPVAFIAEAPPKQQHHYQQKQQNEQTKSTNNQSLSKPFMAGQLRKGTPQPLTSQQQQHHSSKTDVDQLLTGSVSQQYRKDSVRGNLEELRAAESINYRSVVYEYSFRVRDTPSNMRVFTDPGDRRIEAIARSCGTQIQLERPKSSSHYYETRTRRVTVQAPDLHSLEKCCRQFDDRFPHFYVCGGLGLSSKSIKRVYVDDFDGQSTQ